jgi:isoquinoline 1-oxidoreductase subunit beta
MNRRSFLIGGATAAGALVVGYGLWPSDRLYRDDQLAAGPRQWFLANWIKVSGDGAVTVVVPHCDMGTGTLTSLAQMAADEMDADWHSVRAETAPADPLFANTAMAEGYVLSGRGLTTSSIPWFARGLASDSFRFLAEEMNLQTTGGSSAVRLTGVFGMRVAGAAVREMLIRAAAGQMHASAGSFHTRQGRVIHTPSGRSFSYGELAPAAARFQPPTHPRLKAPSEFQLIGKPLHRLDLPERVNGSAKYGIDFVQPGMVYAALRISPVFGGSLVSVNESPIQVRRGIRKVVRLEDAVVVIADRFWRARDAVAALDPVFDDHGGEKLSSQSIRDRQLAALRSGAIKKDTATGSGAAGLNNRATLDCTYSVPYLAHAAMEPLSATALWKTEGTLEVWAGSQDGLGSRAFCAKAASLPLHKVTFHQMPMGGAFGRRLPGAWNYLSYAIEAARALPGVPVKLIFTREQDMRHDYYRPATVSRFRAVLASDGSPDTWVNDYSTEDGANSEAHIAYSVPNQSYGYGKVPSPLPIGSWRSVEAYWHGFFTEAFIDELAHRAGRDPLEYRQSLLQHKPRHLAVLACAAQQAGWGTSLPAGHARGIAVFECFGTVVAEVAHVEVTLQGTLRVHRVTAAADCGMAVNPNGFCAQIEGGIVFGLSAALYDEISIAHGAVVQENFPDYRMVTLADCPAIDVHVVASEAPLGGAGEPGVPPLAPALANAIFAATGVRLRDLPIGNQPLRSTASRA